MAVTSTAPASPEAAYVCQRTLGPGCGAGTADGAGVAAAGNVISSSTSVSSEGSRIGWLRRLGDCAVGTGDGGVPSFTTGSCGGAGDAPAGRVPAIGCVSGMWD